MKSTLQNILNSVEYLKVVGSKDRELNSIVFDSRKAAADSLFVAIKGTVSDGHDFLEQVIGSGCKTIIHQSGYKLPDAEDVTFIEVKDSHLALSQSASAFYGNPSAEMKLIGVTGTNGKTTITTLLHALYLDLGFHIGLLSTVVNKIGRHEIPSTHTTPDPVSLNKLLAEMLEDGCSHCFMEVSSHAIHQKRIAGLEFAGGIFTNITHDHLDYHETFAEYRDVKKSFFDSLPKKAFALTNTDDKNGMFMLQNCAAEKVTYALHTPADFKAKVIENQFSGLVLNLDGTELWSRLIGDFNAYNLLAVYSAATLLGEDKTEILSSLSKLESVEGRFQYVRTKSGLTAIIDYAHTPDALENVLKTISNIRTKNETVFTVIGCGGDRDRAKRPEMAAIACEMSDKVIFTSDNPRSEDPDEIIREMMEGVEGQHYKKTLCITDRFQAIKTAVSMAEKEDIILIAGKGHEKYQEIKGVKHDFDDRKTVMDLLIKLEK